VGHTNADRDQWAASSGPADSDPDLPAGRDPSEHDLSQGIRMRGDRGDAEVARLQSAEARLLAAQQRDAIADARDAAALARDQAAADRDLAFADACDVSDEEHGGALSATYMIEHASARRRAAEQRAHAREQRVLAARDRAIAKEDRDRAAAERRRSLVDRETLYAEVQRADERREDALRHQHRAEQLARVLQRSLSPPSLPRIAGLEVAVHYEPSAPEAVGGDFYDLFPLAACRSGFFLGDVCGKGPDAAAVTSLARYTMRTAAMLHERPEEILMDLNAALLMDENELTPMCTVVYGQVDVDEQSAAITLAVAGQPPPLLVRADGSVEHTSAHGTMLGVIEDPSFHTSMLRFAPGDAIVICSDGILDTRIDGVSLDEDRVSELVAGSPGATAQELVDRLRDALQYADRPLRDDVAIMALRRMPTVTVR
jgi:sigma-B regulation protein RsbU (phosphoserine phosphatase)